MHGYSEGSRGALSTHTQRVSLCLTFKAFRLLLLLGALLAVFGPIPAWAQELFVANSSNDSITVYNQTNSGNVAPVRTITGGATGLNGPFGLALSSSSTGIPTLSEWAQIGMVALLVGGGLLAIRRRRAEGHA